MNKDLLIKFNSFSFSVICISVLISLYSFWFFLDNKIYLIGSDAFAYISIADSILENGEMRDNTTIPSSPIKSPQNGIAFVHVILSILGISAKGRILIIVFINYLLYLSGIFPLYKIARISGLKMGLPLIVLLSAYLGAWHIYRINLLAINDGIFNSIILWLVYLIIKFAQFTDQSKFNSHLILDLKRIIGIILIVMVLIHFRLNVILVIGSAFLSAMIVRKYNVAAWFLTVCLLLVISLFAVYMFMEVSKFGETSRLEGNFLMHVYFYPLFTSITNIYNIKFQLWNVLPRLVSGLSGLTNPLATLLFTIFPLSMIYYGIKGIMERNFNKVFIASICLSGLWFTMFFKNARVIWYTFPFIYLIILSLKRVQYVGYVFVLLVFVQSLQLFYIGYWRGPDSKLFLHIYENNISIPLVDPLLLTHRSRHSYFHLNTRSYRVADDDDGELDDHITFPKELNWDLINQRGSLFVLGDSTYINSAYSQVQEMAILNGYELESNPLTPDLNEFEGWALVEFSGEEIAR